MTTSDIIARWAMSAADEILAGVEILEASVNLDTDQRETLIQYGKAIAAAKAQVSQSAPPAKRRGRPRKQIQEAAS